jgi:membrane protein
MSGGPDKEPVDGLEDGALVLPVPAQERSLSLAEPPEPAPPRSWRERWRCFPWRNTAHTLRERFREDRLGVTASSLTFTTVLALVPFSRWRWRCSRRSPSSRACRSCWNAG